MQLHCNEELNRQGLVTINYRKLVDILEYYKISHEKEKKSTKQGQNQNWNTGQWAEII